MSYYRWQEESLPASTVRVEAQDILRWVYLWMGFGLLVTAGVAVVTVNTPALLSLLASPVLWIALIGELILVFALSAALPRLSPAVASLMFFVYAALNGFTLAGIFLVYTGSSISAAFVATAAMFGAMTIVGFTTRLDLTRFGSFLFMGLIGLLIAMLVNLFLASSGLSMLISVIGVLIFTGLTAYDTQTLKEMARAGFADEEVASKSAVMGALRLYLDFINLFLMLLRIMGRRR